MTVPRAADTVRGTEVGLSESSELGYFLIQLNMERIFSPVFSIS